jgi:hypothetical protein
MPVAPKWLQPMFLPGELCRSRGYDAAGFARYEKGFGPFVLLKQRTAFRLPSPLAPKPRTSIRPRNLAIGATGIPGLSDLTGYQSGNDLVKNYMHLSGLVFR